MEVSAQALSIIDKVTKLQVDVRINSQQCKRLVDRFEYIGQLITKWESIRSAGGDEQPLQAWDGGEVQVSRNFDQLLVVLKKGEALVMECSGQDLRTKVFLNTDNRDAFEEIHRDIDTCASFLHMDDLSSLRKGSGFCTMTEQERANCLTSDAGQDLGKILQLGSETMSGSWEGPQEGAEKLMNAVKHKIERGRYDQESNDLPDGIFMDASDMKITRALGKGGRNIIFEVDWLGCKLAAKYYSNVLPEVKQLSKLRHPHVVQIVGYSKIEDRDVMIMELMDGNLEDLIKDCMQKNGSSNSGPFSQELTLDILYQIARGMQYLHDQGLGHGQLKCSNVLVRTHNSDSIEVKVADFGYANKVSTQALERTGSCVETIGQMDVLDFAQIWCTISSGIVPGDDNRARKNRISFGEHGPQFAIPSERLSPEVEGLVKACLNSVATERPTFEEICHLLDHIRAPKPTYLEPQKSPAQSLKGMFENVFNKVTNFSTHKPLIKCNLEPMPDLSEAEEAQLVSMDLPSYLRIRQSCITLLRQLGQGGSATVYEAEWMGVKFAVKLFRAEMHRIELQREVGLWIKLQHPRIVQLMGFSVAKNSSLIVMELLGGDLRKLIDTRMASMKEGGPFMRREALDVMVQIAEGMAYLHKQGIMHRDLKCLNVLVVGQSCPIHVKIADFGISKYINTPSERGAVGTGFWRAPEVLSAFRDGITQPTYTSKADVYSYGMTCYEVLTGLIPFDGHPRADNSWVLSGNRPDLPKYVSDDVADLITRCWHQEPEQRPEFLDVCHLLHHIRATKPTYLEPQKSPARSLKGMFENVFNKVTNFWRHKPLSKCNLEPMPDLSEADEAQQVCVDLPSHLRIRQSGITLLGKIGQGASATVYEAEWMGVKFAVKSICAEMHSIELQREVGLWMKLQHPRIVQLMGFSVAKNSSLIVMELLGGDLWKLIDTQMASMKEGGPFMRREALDVMVQIAEGMAYLHEQGIVHRDLKCLNVLVVGQSRPIQVKIADFGISKYINTPSERGAVGTGFWRAPEVLSALRDGITQPTYTSKADVYSYGMTCYGVLTGLIPFDGDPRSDYSLVISGKRPELPKYVSDDVADLITRCWHQEPEQRPEFLDICHKLRSFMKAT